MEILFDAVVLCKSKLVRKFLLEIPTRIPIEDRESWALDKIENINKRLADSGEKPLFPEESVVFVSQVEFIDGLYEII